MNLRPFFFALSRPAGALLAGIALSGSPVGAEDSLPAPTVASADSAGETKPEVKPEVIGDNDVDIIIHGQPVKGRVVIPATESRFKFKLHDTATIAEFKWTDLQESERRRVQKMYGLVFEDGQRKFGNKIQGVRVLLDSGKSYEGLPIPDRDQPGAMALRTATSPMVLIRKSEIKAIDNIEKFESDFFSAQEVGDRWLLERPPDAKDAAAHIKLANDFATIGLYDKALDMLEQSWIIDPRTKERTQEMETNWRELFAESQAQTLYDSLLDDLRRREFLSAQERYQQLCRSFPNSSLRSRADTLKAEIETGVKTETVKGIVFLSYRLSDELLKARYGKKTRIDAKGNIVPVIPGKQVTTKQGNIFRGVLLDDIASGGGGTVDPYEVQQGIAKPALGDHGTVTQNDVVLKCKDMTVTIAGKDIVSIVDIDLSVADKLVEASFDELKEYVTDTGSPEGLKGEMIKKISELTRLPEKKVQEIFDHRLDREGRFEDGKFTVSQCYATEHQASYGKGSWLREGSKPMANPDNNHQQHNVRVERVRSGNGTYQYKVAEQQQQQEENPDTTDDPLIWWKYQNNETRLNILRGMMAEKVFKRVDDPNNPVKQICPNCSNAGILTVTGIGGNPMQVRCPDCRGIGVFFKIRYH